RARSTLTVLSRAASSPTNVVVGSSRRIITGIPADRSNAPRRSPASKTGRIRMQFLTWPAAKRVVQSHFGTNGDRQPQEFQMCRVGRTVRDDPNPSDDTADSLA